MKNWQPYAIGLLLLAIFLLTLGGRYLGCVVRVVYDPDQFGADIDDVQDGCFSLLDPFKIFR